MAHASIDKFRYESESEHFKLLEFILCQRVDVPRFVITIIRVLGLHLIQYKNSVEDLMFVFKGITVKNASTPFRMVIIVSVSGLFIIGMVFTAAYTSYLTTPIFRKTLVNSVEDLANSKTVKTLLIKGSSTDEYIMVRSTYLSRAVTILPFPPYRSQYRSQPAKSVVKSADQSKR